MSMAGRLRRGAMLATGGALLLAACAEEKVAEPQPAENRDASGEVLEGSISDAMIPMDQLRSQPPRMKVAPAEGGSEEAAEGAEEATPSEDEGAAQEPAAEETEGEGEASAAE